jgi:hypothetical protein
MDCPLLGMILPVKVDSPEIFIAAEVPIVPETRDSGFAAESGCIPQGMRSIQ